MRAAHAGTPHLLPTWHTQHDTHLTHMDSSMTIRISQLSFSIINRKYRSSRFWSDSVAYVASMSLSCRFESAWEAAL
ncbi:MAG: hypothetical protein J2P36_36640 [Ktedonobacteraceae bacterium]|nr:hypothetical protein [Ktedonobacteraceae bacterium]